MSRTKVGVHKIRHGAVFLHPETMTSFQMTIWYIVMMTKTLKTNIDIFSTSYLTYPYKDNYFNLSTYRFISLCCFLMKQTKSCWKMFLINYCINREFRGVKLTCRFYTTFMEDKLRPLSEMVQKIGTLDNDLFVHFMFSLKTRKRNSCKIPIVWTIMIIYNHILWLWLFIYVPYYICPTGIINLQPICILRSVMMTEVCSIN